MDFKFITFVLVLGIIQFSSFSQSSLAKQSSKRINHNKTQLDSILDRNSLVRFVLNMDTNKLYFEIPEKVFFMNSGLDSIANKLGIQPIVKLDLNDDNNIDLIIFYTSFDIYYLYIDEKTKSIKLEYINGARGDQILRPIYLNHKIVFEHSKYRYKYDGQQLQTKLIVNQVEFINGGFIESTRKSPKYGIEAIEFSAEGCYGECPIFKLNILNNRSATYNAIEFNDTKGSYTGIIDPKSYTELAQLLNYIDFTSVENEYQVGHTDDQTGILKITYNNGNVKEIHDYGMSGTLGLSKLYKMFFKFRTNQIWK